MNTRSGVVFNIQRFSTHDGPGIRTTVFIKGCPLGCWWCSNPESQNPEPQLMVRDVKCVSCGACAVVCPAEAVSFTPERARVIDWSRCIQCLDCAEACLYEALCVSGEIMSVDEAAQEVLSDRVFYENSGGGATISGGEPLGQPEFLEELLRVLKAEGIHVALDTTGLAPWKHYQRILPLVDLVLFDLKHPDPDQHKKYTGADNRLILENGRKIAERARTWLRIPLIPGINDSVEHLEMAARIAIEWGVEKVSLLPYHQGGESKASQIGAPYLLSDLKACTEEDLEAAAGIFIRAGVTVSIRL